MALSIDTSPVRKFAESLSQGATPEVWMWQAAVAALAFALAWVVTRILFRQTSTSHRWKFGERDFRRAVFPAAAYLFVVIGRALLSRHQSVAVLDILAPVLVAAIVLRVAVSILARVLPPGALLRALLRSLAGIAWIAVLLHVTGLLPEVIQTLDEIGFTAGKQRISVWIVAQGAAALAITLTVALWLARVTEGRVMAAETVDLSTRVVLAKLVRVAAVFVAVLVALPLVGIDVTTLSIFSGALGVGLGFGLQKIAANYVSGFIVLMDRSLRIGDTVTIDGRRGEVKEIASRYTVIQGGDGSESIVPNEKLITEVVNHHTYSDPRISIVLTVTVGYETDVDTACAHLLAAATREKRVISDPAPVARVKALGERGIELELIVWMGDPTLDSTLRSELYKDVLRAFRAAAIEIPYPRRDVHLFTTTEMDNSSPQTRG